MIITFKKIFLVSSISINSHCRNWANFIACVVDVVACVVGVVACVVVVVECVVVVVECVVDVVDVFAFVHGAFCVCYSVGISDCRCLRC